MAHSRPKTASLEEAHRQGHSGSAEQPSFNWNVSDKYVELISFKLDVTNILQTKTYELTEEEEKVSVIKNYLVIEGIQLIQKLTSSEKGAYKTVKGQFSSHPTTKQYYTCNAANVKEKVISPPRSGWEGCILKLQVQNICQKADGTMYKWLRQWKHNRTDH